MDKSFVLSETSKGVKESMTTSISNIKEIKTYIKDLKSYTNNMTAIVKNLSNSSNENREDNMVTRKKTSGLKKNPSKMEYGVSLNMGSSIKHDVSNVLNDALKNHLCYELPGNKTKLFDSKELLKHLILIEDIRRAEKDVMEVQERFLKANDTGGYFELRPWNIENYSLLRLRIFGDNSNVEKKSDLKENVSKKIVYGIHHELRELRLSLNNKRPKLSIKKKCKPENTRKYPAILLEKPKGANLFVNKHVIHFKRFVPGGIYKKTAIITNTGKQMVIFKILSNGSSDKGFSYNYTPRGLLAPGMNAKLTVTFNCKSMAHIYDYITIVTRENTNIYIIVYAENENPILRYITECYEEENNCKRENSKPITSGICVFECNTCLVGSTKNVTIAITNIGRSSKFVCVPEDVWYKKALDDVEWNKSMRLCAFKIVPSIFEINSHQSIALNVSFKPCSPSFYCSRFIIIADNSCAHEVNVFGDGQMFDGPNAIWLEGQNLRSNHGTAATAETGKYVLDMGKIGEVVQYVYAKNASRIKYPFRWIINHAIVKPSSKDAKINFNIHPSMGLLDKDTMFRVECGVTDEIVNEQLTGEYRVTATMMIDDIPKESLNDNQDIFFEKQEDSLELLSIRVAEMEVISTYSGKERISLCVDPVIVDLNWYKLQTDLCVKETVNFVNSGPCPVRVSWIPEVADECASVTVEPAWWFEVAGRASVSVRVEPKRPGRLRVPLKFRTENREGDSGETVVYVRGTVERTPEVRVRPTVEAPGEICVGAHASYAVQLKVRSDGPFDVRRRLYELDAGGDLSPYCDAKSFGPYGNECSFLATLHFQTPIRTVATGISCQLAEWSLDAGSKTVHTQVVTYVRLPNVRLNINTVTIAESLYKGVAFGYKGIRLLNNTHCDFIYSWGNPMGSDANGMDCAFKPTTGLVRGKSFVDFEFTVTPKKSGHFKRYYVPCFVQCNAIAPLTISIECWANDFSATISYINTSGIYQNIKWNNKINQWTVDDNLIEIDQMENEYVESECKPISSNSLEMECSLEYEIEPEDLEPAKWRFTKWPRRDTLLWSPGLEQFGRIPNHFHSVMAFKDVECNTAMKHDIIIRNPTKIPCRVNTKFDYYDFMSSGTNDVESTVIKEKAEFGSIKHCMIWIEKDVDILKGQDEVRVSVWVLPTVWGRYQGLITIELHVDTDILPAIHIPLIVQAITFPIEYPLALDVHNPTINLHSMNSEHQLQILNISEIPVQVSWRIYNKSKKNKPFGVVFDTLTPDFPNLWSFRINRFYGLEEPRYFMVEPVILRLKPKEQGFVTFFLDRTKEIYINRDEKNIVHGKAVGIVTALEPSGKYCIREDGFKLKPTIVKLYSETKHSIYPNLELRELDNIFQISATQIYNSQLPYHTVTRLFTMVNHLQYPVTIKFYINKPFIIKSSRTLRCGNRPGNANIRVFYKDLIEIELQADINIKYIRTPKMPLNILPRKDDQIGYLYAICEDSYYKPKVVASFEVHVHFPILKLSTRNINFGQVVVRETKSIDVMLSSYPGPEHFVTSSEDDVFTISPVRGIVSHMPALLTIAFRPKAEVLYSNKIKILTTIPNDVIFLDVSGIGIK